MNDIEIVQANAKRVGFIAGCEWKDLENRWHKISDGDFPKITGDYLVVSKNKNKEDENKAE